MFKYNQTLSNIHVYSNTVCKCNCKSVQWFSLFTFSFKIVKYHSNIWEHVKYWNVGGNNFTFILTFFRITNPRTLFALSFLEPGYINGPCKNYCYKNFRQQRGLWNMTRCERKRINNVTWFSTILQLWYVLVYIVAFHLYCSWMRTTPM